MRADVIGIDILERGGGRAVDELTVALPEPGLIDLLIAEINRVEGVAIEDVRTIDAARPDSGMLALQVVVDVGEALPGERLAAFCAGLVDLADAEWAVAIDLDAATTVWSTGVCPDIRWIAAFLAGSSHLSAAEQAAGAPGDLAWTRLGDEPLAVVVGRANRMFHSRERHQIALLGRIAASLIVSLPVS